ncbi:MAG TPA: nuclear transport factor 2 family protein [Terracidiphilus sp.]|jgi:ketosteroid isomerase-like protein|nr:nuclear transport factor 2 family protein [Terracidiphilus sp.]
MNCKFAFAAVIFLSLFPAFGRTPRPPKQSDTAILQQIERGWAAAFVHKDQAALGRILAPDWRGQYPWGNENRPQALAAVVSGTAYVQSMTLGEMRVRVFGDIAFSTGSDDERSSYAGKDTSGHFSWTDIYARRNGHWLAIASQLTSLPK